MTESDLKQIATVAKAFGPVLQALFEQRTRPEVVHEAQVAALTVVRANLLVANGAVLLANLQAIAHLPEKVVEFFREHAASLQEQDRDTHGSG